MLDDNRKKLIQLLIALAWADGRIDAEEIEVVEAVLDSFEADPETAEELREWAKEPRGLDDVDASDLTAQDMELVLFQAVLLTYIDGEQSPKELELLDAFIAKLGIEKERADAILETANARAKDLLPFLEE